VVVVVVALLGADVVHLVDGAALGASLDGTVLGDGEPYDDVAVGGASGASQVALITVGRDSDGVVEGSWASLCQRLSGHWATRLHLVGGDIIPSRFPFDWGGKKNQSSDTTRSITIPRPPPKSPSLK